MQNAADAASLAGVQALNAGPSTDTSAANRAVSQYLTLHGCPANAQTTVTTTFPASPGTGALQTVTLQITHQHSTFFIQLLGINTIPISVQASASSANPMVDVMLSLDLTGSMELSGTNDLAHLRSAVVSFINQVNLTANSPRGPQVGMARFAGIMCGWNRSSKTETTINLGPGPSEYVGPCTDDETVLSGLTQDKSSLLTIADNSGGTSCPPSIAQFACPLVSWTYSAPVVSGMPQVTPRGMTYNGQSFGSLNPTYTGTKLPNAISVVSNGSFYAWSTANGGRNDPTGVGVAHKVLVMITDGNDELWPAFGMPAGVSSSAWDTQVVQEANALKLGPDGIAGTADDVEIYVVGFYCTPYSSASSNGTNPNWCTSKLADTAQPHPCPSSTWQPALASPTDTLLYEISSSTPGTCDHYFPIKKTENLPQLFQMLGNQIAWPRLTQ